METLVCPICCKKGLTHQGTGWVKKSLIVCENEQYIHWAFGTHHFLSLTKEKAQENEFERLTLATN